MWRVGLEQELLIYKPFNKEARSKWTEPEVEVLLQYFTTGKKEDLMAVLPGRGWTAIKDKAKDLGLYRESWKRTNGCRFTAEEDGVVRRYYTREIGKEEAEALTGREIESIRVRAGKLGLIKPRAATTWEWMDRGSLPEKSGSSKPSAPARRS
ncbi:MAG: hypothetical protein HYR94_24830 [Chloroflexi bacterium]|nr:hypothetical protein [Chloroflexota bacterium]